MSESALAAVVLTHADPDHLHRLTNALDDVPMFVHCDRRTPADVYARMVAALPSRVTMCDRVPTQLASWSLVHAELIGLREALKRSDAQHIAVLSGSDYPLLSVPDLVAELEVWSGRTWMANFPMPYAPWRTPRHQDGGMWRLEHRFLQRNGNVRFIAGFPLRWPKRRAVPADIVPRAASQWKIYARHHAERLLTVTDDRPDLLRFWQTTLVPDESFAASMLASPRLFGSDALQAKPTGAWYLEWDQQNSGHPRWLGEGDFERLHHARVSPSLDPDDASGDDFGYNANVRKLFARKFSTSISGSLLDRVDGELRGTSAVR